MTRGIALSFAVCTIALLAAPALAAGPTHGGAGFTLPWRSTVSTNPAGMGLHLFTLLQVMAIPVAGPLIALSWAGRPLHRFLSTALGAKPAIFPRNFSRGIGLWGLNRSAFPAGPGFRIQNGVMGIAAAENLTTYLHSKGYNVSDLDTSLSVARAALAGSNLTAYRTAMGTFRKDLEIKITAGTINQSVILDYLKALPAANRVPGMVGTVGLGRGFMPRWSGNQPG